MSLKIGSLTLKSKAILAPLERVSDVGFRRLCFKNGAALTWTEMVYASDFSKGRPSAVNLVDTHDPDTLTGVQFLIDRTTARDNWGVDTLHRALEALEHGANADRPEWKNIVAIDLNFGCPSPNLRKRGAGPSQLRRRSKILNIFEALSKWKKETTNLCNIKAVGAKIRLGVNQVEQNHKVYIPVAEAAATANLDYLVVHSRNAEQRSRDEPTWEAIREIKQTVLPSSDLKIIGNGNVKNKSDMEKMMITTNCDGVVVGRSAMNNPWSLRDLSSDGNQNNNLLPTIDEFEESFEEYKTWSTGRPAYLSRYKSFHDANFDRMRREILQASRNQ